MGWKDSIKKEKFQGPKRQYADFTPSKFDLGLRLKSIDYLLNKSKEALENFMEGLGDEVDESTMVQLRIALKHIDSIENEIDNVDAQMMESEKYSQRTDSDDMHLYGAKFRDRDD